MQDSDVHNNLLSSLSRGKVHIVTGKNGAGKSRFFEYATRQLCIENLQSRRKYARLLCLSGTLHDKYPKEIVDDRGERSDVVYLGYKVNNNMFSELTPFRTTLPFLLAPEQATAEACRVAGALLKSINIDAEIEFKLRMVRGAAKELRGELPLSFKISLTEHSETVREHAQFLTALTERKVTLTDISFHRDGETLGAAELSSGERSYLQSVLGAAFCGKQNSVFFYDEPENSLHPEWHLKMARDISDLVGELHPESVIVIATHSPLVASSIPNKKLLICDLPRDQKWAPSTLHGKTNDAILSEHFHLFSPRSKEVAILIQKCLSELTKGREVGPLFQQSANRLYDMKLDIDNDDPLFSILMTIMKHLDKP